MENSTIQDSLPRVPIVTHGWSSDGSYAHLKEPHHECAEGSLPRVHNTALVGPSSLGSPHGCHPLKTIVPSTGYDALFSSSEKRGTPSCRRCGYKKIGSIEWVASVLWIQVLCLSTAHLVFPCFWSKGNNRRFKVVTVAPLWWRTHPVLSPQGLKTNLESSLEFHGHSYCRRVWDVSRLLFIIGNSFLLYVDIHCL